MKKNAELRLGAVAREFLAHPPCLEFKAGDNTNVKLQFDIEEVLDFCVNNDKNAAKLMQDYCNSLASPGQLRKQLYERSRSDSDGRQCNPPLNYQISTRIEKSKEVRVNVFPAKSPQKQIKREYFLVTDFAAKDFIKKFEELAGLKVRPDFLNEKTAKPIGGKTIDSLVKGTILEEYLADLLLHTQTIPGYLRYELTVEKGHSQCKADIPINTLYLGGRLHIEFVEYGEDL